MITDVNDIKHKNKNIDYIYLTYKLHFLSLLSFFNTLNIILLKKQLYQAGVNL